MSSKRRKAKSPAPKVAAPGREAILEAALEHLQQAVAWKPMLLLGDGCDNSLRYLTKAIALIELLEVFDCGSVGGYDKGQTKRRTAFDRWEWLVLKHNPKSELLRGLQNTRSEFASASF